MKVKLRMSGRQYAAIRNHLYSGDGNESVAFALCGRRRGQANHVLCVQSVHPVAYADCTIRTPDRVTWKTDSLVPVLREATKNGASILKLHSHPTGVMTFSPIEFASTQHYTPLARPSKSAGIFWKIPPVIWGLR